MVPDRNLFSSKMKLTSIMYIETREKPASKTIYHSSAAPSPVPGISLGRCRPRSAPDSQTGRSRPHPPARADGLRASSGFEAGTPCKRAARRWAPAPSPPLRLRG